MGRHASQDSIVVHEGVYLKMMGAKYQCYFRLAGRQFRKSTKTADLGAAKLKALQWYQEAQTKLARGDTIESVSFARLKREYLQYIRTETKHGYHLATIERHFLPFFARYDDISKIRRSEIVQYVAYRRAKGEKAPTPQTINRENSVLRQLLRYAVDRGWINEIPRIPNESERLSARRRRHFTFEELRRLMRLSRRRAKEFDGIELKTRQGWNRKLLADVIALMVNTGLRVDESTSLRWRNVDWADGSILLERAGKTRSSRRVLMRRGAIMALKRLRARRIEFQEKYGEDTGLNEEEIILALPNGIAVHSFKKGFDRLLEAAGFTYADRSKKHSLTSLRHTYATFRLTTRSGKRASMRALAKQMGTSERMIERHYGHDEIIDYREELVGSEI